MSAEKILFLVASMIVIHGVAHIYGTSIYVGKMARSNGKVCEYLDTTFKKKSIYYSTREIPDGCPKVHFEE